MRSAMTRPAGNAAVVALGVGCGVGLSVEPFWPQPLHPAPSPSNKRMGIGAKSAEGDRSPKVVNRGARRTFTETTGAQCVAATNGLL